MTHTSSAALRASLSMMFTGALVVGGLSAPALASPKDRSGKGQSSKASSKPSKPARTSPAVTEDNDDDGVPNHVVDAGDNQHPSGKDRSVEHGGSGNQGKSSSDPDRTTNGGTDKPGGRGGVDRHDQDGNNGCGNDDDFEDDNNGHCGGRRRANRGSSPDRPARPTPPAVNPVATDPAATDPANTVPGVTPATDSVLGLDAQRPANFVVPAGLTSLHNSHVLGTRLSRVTDPASLSDPLSANAASHGSHTSGRLPHTGWDASALSQLALMLLGAGGMVMVTSRRRPTATTG